MRCVRSMPIAPPWVVLTLWQPATAVNARMAAVRIAVRLNVGVMKVVMCSPGK